ncbi:hypothetical protein C3941_26195 [Kaistia algarum]|nr:hypothetical protein C3941_26195 [Kaistia algarum]
MKQFHVKNTQMQRYVIQLLHIVIIQRKSLTQKLNDSYNFLEYCIKIISYIIFAFFKTINSFDSCEKYKIFK